MNERSPRISISQHSVSRVESKVFAGRSEIVEISKERKTKSDNISLHIKYEISMNINL